ncbi:MAG: cupin domain-containing protein [Sulfuricurvum sp.]|jgi:cupin 2 domain-containing protein|uniref:cupin domain-containing protein n=1 Tax=Sulfuricurvum sp. TaxID=2025608 RepID=UPI0025DBA4CB|nr:cupin domain-containing protein [Sulfuricurvum sp.]MCK9372860.1 cupin domain-containing protein [Sulfuricurvum sp.]
MNIYDLAKPESDRETFVTFYQTGSLKIEGIRSHLTRPGIEYFQQEDEWVILLEGAAQLEMDGELRRLQKGDFLFIPRHTPHRVLSTSNDALWIAIFS